MGNQYFPSVESLEPISDTERQRGFGVFDGDEKHLKCLEDLYTSCSDIVVIVQHEVDGFPIGTTRKRKGGDGKHIHKIINIFEVALTFLTEMKMSATDVQYLRSHKSTLRCHCKCASN